MHIRAWFPAIAFLLAAPSFAHADRKLNLGEIALQASRMPFADLERTQSDDGSRRALVDGHYVIVRQTSGGGKDLVVLGSQRRVQPQAQLSQAEYSVRPGDSKAKFVRTVTTVSGKGPDDVTAMRFITPSVSSRIRASFGMRPGQSMSAVGFDHDHSNYTTPRFNSKIRVSGDRGRSMKSIVQSTRQAYGAWKGQKSQAR